jgi:PAS domain S-box-containing protein
MNFWPVLLTLSPLPKAIAMRDCETPMPLELKTPRLPLLGLDPSHWPALRLVSVHLTILAVMMLGIWWMPTPPGVKGVAGYEPLHTFFETISVIICALIFAVTWNAPRRHLPGNMVVLACAFAGVAVLDFSHLLSIQGMPDYVTPSDPEKAINFWLAARLLAATALLTFALRDPHRQYSTAVKYGVLMAVVVAIAMVHVLVLIYPQWIPRTFINGQGLTEFKRAAEYGLIGLNIAAIVCLWWQMRKPLPYNAAAVVGAIAAMGMSEFFLTLYSDVNDIYLVAGHVYKVISYLYLYRAIFVEAIDRPYLELHQSREALQRSREDLAITLNSIGDAVIATDAQGLITRMNPVAERLTGWPLADAIGQPLTAVFHIISAETRLPSVNPVQLVMEHGQVVGLANHAALIARGGQEYQIADSAAPIRDASHAIVGVVLVFSDVTEKYRAEEALRASEQHFEAIVQAMSDVVYRMSADWSLMHPLDGRALVASNDTPLAGWAWLDQNIPADEHARVRQAIGVAIAQKAFFSLEHRVLRPDGSIGWTASRAVPILDAHGKVREWFGAASDITMRKVAELALQAALHEKTALLLEVHHRVKNNLQIITSLLRLESFRSTDAPTQSVLQDMQGRVRSMALLHETIYRKGTFAAIDLGSYVGQIAGESLKSMQVNPGAVRLQLDMETLQVGLDQATPAGMLVSELVSNCLKHAFPEGHTGEIGISLHPLPEPDQWRLRVSDSGIGLTPDFEERRKTSLGLQLAGDMATQMGGTLHIGSGPQAVFTVDFKAEVPAPLKINLDGAKP